MNKKVINQVVEKTVEERYKKRELHEHVLKEPGMFIGNVKPDKLDMYIYDDKTNKIIKKQIMVPLGLYKIIDEIIVNARDQSDRTETCTTIKVNLNKETGEISVLNDGLNVAVEIHKEYNIYTPELVFGNLLVSENYDVKKKTVGGKNGLGAKLANIYSKEFNIEIGDEVRKKIYKQKFTKNMYEIHKPVITDTKKIKSYIKISFIPDYKKFELESLTDDIIALLKKRVYDISACTEKINVYFNDVLIKIKSLDKYIELFYDEMPSNLVYGIINERWTVGVLFDQNSGFNQVSYVNGICTFQGGTHVEYIVNQITKKILKYIKEKHPNLVIKPSFIKENLNVFVNSIIEDPSFPAQSKDFMDTPIDLFGSTCELPTEFIDTLIKTGIVNTVIELAKFKEEQNLKKTDGKKKNSLFGIDKLEDANWAGTKKSSECTIILTEGDSAQSFAIEGFDVLGRDRFGAFALKGKPMNVRDAPLQKILKNTEFENIKKILGLKQNKVYDDVKELRYGKILILTDQDYDGSHIKGLIINMFHKFWPSLLKIDGFMQSMTTPLLKMFKNTDKKQKFPVTFYTFADYHKWVSETMNGNTNGWEASYYKGLGTSTPKEAKECFHKYNETLINYKWNMNDQDKERSDTAIKLAFDKNLADERKIWLRRNNIEQLELKNGDIPIYDFIDKDLVFFSLYDVARSIPSLMDGSKPSNRKILCGAFKGGLDKHKMKVSQFGAYVAQHTGYHHGEASILGAIIKMAQTFLGTNNINLLVPLGAFGSRRKGGLDAASPRYIFTRLNQLTAYIYKKEDECILDYLKEENQVIEPKFYAPIIPMILVNGAEGIGTGFSTDIPSFNPIDICNNLLRLIDEKDVIKMKPWYRGFTGNILKKNDKYITIGTYKIIDETTIHISELPVGTWTKDYCDYLDACCMDDRSKKIIEEKNKKKGKPKKNIKIKEKFIDDYKNNSGNNSINITITFNTDKLLIFEKNGELLNKLKLITSISLTNFHLFNENNIITKYDCIEDILSEFYRARLLIYNKRKEYIIPQIKNDMLILQYKIKFINDYINGEVVVHRKKKIEVHDQLEKLKYPKLSRNHLVAENLKNYDYLDVNVFSLTEENLAKLNNEFDKEKLTLETYIKIKPTAIWKNEICEFMKQYEIWMKEAHDEDDDEENLMKTAKESNKKVTKKQKPKAKQIK